MYDESMSKKKYKQRDLIAERARAIEKSKMRAQTAKGQIEHHQKSGTLTKAIINKIYKAK